jgi:hypothetical protein
VGIYILCAALGGFRRIGADGRRQPQRQPQRTPEDDIVPPQSKHSKLDFEQYTL